MAKKLFIIRGIPGSGKTTLAKKITPYVFEADDFFMKSGQYKFDKSSLTQAHESCQESVRSAMSIGVYPIAVSNTFVRKWEYRPYLDLANEYGYQYEVIVCHGNFKNVHGVPQDVVLQMKRRFEDE